MKHLALAVALLATPAMATPAHQQPLPAQPKIYVVQLSIDDMRVIARALDIAAEHCGLNSPDACRIGLFSAGIVNKFNASVNAAPQKK